MTIERLVRFLNARERVRARYRQRVRRRKLARMMVRLGVPAGSNPKALSLHCEGGRRPVPRRTFVLKKDGHTIIVVESQYHMKPILLRGTPVPWRPFPPEGA